MNFKAQTLLAVVLASCAVSTCMGLYVKRMAAAKRPAHESSHSTPDQFVVNVINETTNRREMQIRFARSEALCHPPSKSCPKFLIMSTCWDLNDMGIGMMEVSHSRISGQVRCVRTGRTFEVELSGNLQRTGHTAEMAGSVFANGAPWPLFRSSIIGRWEIEEEAGDMEGETADGDIPDEYSE